MKTYTVSTQADAATMYNTPYITTLYRTPYYLRMVGRFLLGRFSRKEL